MMKMRYPIKQCVSLCVCLALVLFILLAMNNVNVTRRKLDTLKPSGDRLHEPLICLSGKKEISHNSSSCIGREHLRDIAEMLKHEIRMDLKQTDQSGHVSKSDRLPEHIWKVPTQRKSGDNIGIEDPHEHVIRVLSETKRKLVMRSDDPRTAFNKGYDLGLSKECLDRNYGDLRGWPKASVVIPFCENELLVDVLHTVHSIIQRSPDEILKEVILIDDNTKKADFKEIFENYCSSVFGEKVRIIRTNVTLGLIQGRLRGARAARGDVIVTMDAHMEVQETWLHALLFEIKNDRKTMGTAMLDWMRPAANGTFSYERGASSFMCVFGWDLGFGFAYPRPEIDNIRKQNATFAFPAPCSVGTIWAMDKAFFTEIGELDEDMKLWGGENLDLPLRVWLFGGRHVQVPCSHAAHLERPHQRDYRYGWDNSIRQNYKRVIEVWFDEYKEHAYNESPGLKDVKIGDISARLKLKKKAKYDFKWFLANVYPELGIPNNNTFGYSWLKNLGLNKCLHRFGGVTLWECKGEPNKENIWLTTDGYLRTAISYWVSHDEKQIKVLGSEGATGTYKASWLSKWIHWKGGPVILYVNEKDTGASKNLCLQGNLKPKTLISVVKCDPNNLKQRWEFKTYTKDYADFMASGATGLFDTDYHKTTLSLMKKWETPGTSASQYFNMDVI